MRTNGFFCLKPTAPSICTINSGLDVVLYAIKISNARDDNGNDAYSHAHTL